MEKYNSPLSEGNAPNLICNYALSKGISPLALSKFFALESSGGTKGIGAKTNNPGNITSLPNYPSYKGFTIFPSALDGAYATVDLLAGKKYVGEGRKTLGAVLEKYAPPSENNTQLYINNATEGVAQQLERAKLLAEIIVSP